MATFEDVKFGLTVEQSRRETYAREIKTFSNAVGAAIRDECKENGGNARIWPLDDDGTPKNGFVRRKIEIFFEVLPHGVPTDDGITAWFGVAEVANGVYEFETAALPAPIRVTTAQEAVSAFFSGVLKGFQDKTREVIGPKQV